MNVIYQNTEDDAEDTVVPRFINAGGDLNRIFFIDESDAALSIADKRIGETIRRTGVKNPVLIAPSFQKSGTVDSCRMVPVGSIHLLGDYTLVTNQVKAASHRMATRP